MIPAEVMGLLCALKQSKKDPENSGLIKAIQLLQPIVEKYPWLSTADIWILAGYVAIEATGGPPIPFSFGRQDYTEEEAMKIYGKSLCPFGDGKLNPNKSRLPSADLGSNKSAPQGCPHMHIKEKPTIDHVRSIFTRLGFTDQETVCLIILGHQYGRCHLENSGYEHAWYVFGPTEYNVSIIQYNTVYFIICIYLYHRPNSSASFFTTASRRGELENSIIFILIYIYELHTN